MVFNGQKLVDIQKSHMYNKDIETYCCPILDLQVSTKLVWRNEEKLVILT
jgi:hypothetical protein